MSALIQSSEKSFLGWLSVSLNVILKHSEYSLNTLKWFTLWLRQRRINIWGTPIAKMHASLTQHTQVKIGLRNYLYNHAWRHISKLLSVFITISINPKNVLTTSNKKKSCFRMLKILGNGKNLRVSERNRAKKNYFMFVCLYADARIL